MTDRICHYCGKPIEQGPTCMVEGMPMHGRCYDEYVDCRAKAQKPVTSVEVLPSQPVNQASRFIEGKLPLHLIPPEFFESLGEVFQFGAKKYGERNCEKGLSEDNLIGPALRHIVKVMQGIYIDEESGCSSAAMAAWSLLILDMQRRRRGQHREDWEEWKEHQEIEERTPSTLTPAGEELTAEALKALDPYRAWRELIEEHTVCPICKEPIESGQPICAQHGKTIHSKCWQPKVGHYTCPDCGCPVEASKLCTTCGSSLMQEEINPQPARQPQTIDFANACALCGKPIYPGEMCVRSVDDRVAHRDCFIIKEAAPEGAADQGGSQDA